MQPLITMNASKFLSFLSQAAALGAVTALVAFAVNFYAFALFGAAVATFVVLVLASDYAPRGYSSYAPASVRSTHATHSLRLAA